MPTPDDPLRRALREDVFPAMLAVAPAHRGAVLRLLLALIVQKMAEQAGLEWPPAGTGYILSLPQPDDADESFSRVLAAGRQRLDRLDFSRADVYLPGTLYADLSADRHRCGIYYTPPDLALRVARRTIEPLLPLPASPAGDGLVSVLDPAAGSGSFLIAAGEVLANWLITSDPALTRSEARRAAVRQLYGIDRDPLAVELAAISLWLWAAHPGISLCDFSDRLLCGDALLDPLEMPLFDAVIGNPPFASVFTRARIGEDQHSAMQARYETATGSFDLAVPFVERAIRLCRPGGRVGLVLPNKLLSADYARRLREWLGEQTTVEAILDYSEQLPFEAGAYPVAIIFRRRSPEPAGPLTVYHAGRRHDTPYVIRQGTQSDLRTAPGSVWSVVLDPGWDDLRRCCEGTIPLSDMAELAAGLTVAEAYALRDSVIDAPPGIIPPDAVRLVTSGLIDRHRTLWGNRTARFLNRRYRHPVVMVHALPPRRRMQALADKVIVSGLSRHPQALMDRGMAQASVGTTIITGGAWPPGALCALINSEIVARLCRALFGGLALSGGYLRLGKRELGLIPVPALSADDPRIAQLEALAMQIARADRLDRPALDAQIDTLVRDLYGVRDES